MALLGPSRAHSSPDCPTETVHMVTGRTFYPICLRYVSDLFAIFSYTITCRPTLRSQRRIPKDFLTSLPSHFISELSFHFPSLCGRQFNYHIAAALLLSSKHRRKRQSVPLESLAHPQSQELRLCTAFESQSHHCPSLAHPAPSSAL